MLRIQNPTKFLTAALTVLLVTFFNTVHADGFCDQPTTSIQEVQGNQQSSPLQGQQVWVKGIMTGDFRKPESLGGFFIQNQSSERFPASSGGLFINYPTSETALNKGDLVVIKGTVSEDFEVTQLNSIEQLEVCQSGMPVPEPMALQLPLNLPKLESVEGMRVTLAKPHVITDVYNYLRFGELVVSQKLLLSPTAQYRPGKQAQQHAKLIKQSQLIVDDGKLAKYPISSTKGADGQNLIAADNAVRVGQSIEVTGIMHFAFGRFKLQASDALKIGPGLASSASQPVKPPGDFSVATFNIENLFSSLDVDGSMCGPLKDFGCRGADNAEELQRQLAKLVAVINATNASVMGIQELENNESQSSQTLVDGLNAAAGFNKWAFIDTGALGEDVIKVGLIYQPNKLKPKGPFALLNAAADPEFLEHRNRIVVAQTFVTAAGQAVNVASVHFKSKSCRDAVDLDLDQKDGQSCYNPTRVQVANQVAKWLANDPTGQGAKAIFLVGDFNSYQHEDPMQALYGHGYTNLADHYLGAKNWTASYRGMLGSLDYVLANEEAKKLTLGASQWHINSVSAWDFGYNLEPLDEGVDKPARFYQADPFRSSDHDVVLVGFEWPAKDS